GGVDDDHAALGEVVQVRLQCCGVHRDEHVGPVAGGHDVEVCEVQLEAGDAGQCPLRRADLGREVGQGGDVVAEARGLGGEPIACQLHPVTGIPGESNHNAIERLGLSHEVLPYFPKSWATAVS